MKLIACLLISCVCLSAVRTAGQVRTPEGLLIDDFRVVSLGESDGAGAVAHPEKAEQRSVVEVAVE